MTRHKYSKNRERKGNITVLSAFLMVAVVGMAAFSVDLGYLANSQAELQRCADAAALSACADLIYTNWPNNGTPGTPINIATGVAMVPTTASKYAAANSVCGSGPSVGASDVVVGYMANPSPSASISTSASQSLFNSVQVTVNRTSSENGQVPTFFGRLFDVTGASTTCSATAAFLYGPGIAGFQAPTSVNGGSGQTCNLMILPYTLDEYTCMNGPTTDNWAWDSSTGTVSAGSDGICEWNLFPQSSIQSAAPGNRGIVNIGVTNNSTCTLVSQIEYGITPAQMAMYPNGLVFDSSGNLTLSGNPGMHNGTASALASIVGQTRCIPIFNTVSGNGNNASYNIVAWMGVRVMAVNSNGAPSGRYLEVQPATVVTRGAIGLTPGSSTATAGSYYSGVYSPIWLVK